MEPSGSKRSLLESRVLGLGSAMKLHAVSAIRARSEKLEPPQGRRRTV